ncbi:hypothetical protein [Arthrobacter sp. UYCu723]
MEAIGDFIPFQDTEQDAGRVTGRGPARALQPGLDSALAGLQEVGSTAAGDAGGLGIPDCV